MTGLIEACEAIDNDLAASISVRAKPLLVLEDVEAGSVTAWLKYFLESIDDDALKSLDWKKAVGTYLVSGKRRLVQFLERRSTVRNADEIYKLQGALNATAGEAGLTQFSLNAPVPAQRVAEDLRLLSDATSPLLPADVAQYVTGEGPVLINASFRLTSEAIENILTQEHDTTTLEVVLVVKKPDFLGDSMWDFQYEGKRISAKVLDLDWLGHFRSGRIALHSGDALQALLEKETNLGKNGELLGTHYRILNVRQVIHRDA